METFVIFVNCSCIFFFTKCPFWSCMKILIKAWSNIQSTTVCKPHFLSVKALPRFDSLSKLTTDSLSKLTTGACEDRQIHPLCRSCIFTVHKPLWFDYLLMYTFFILLSLMQKCAFCCLQNSPFTKYICDQNRHDNEIKITSNFIPGITQLQNSF